LNLGTIKAVLCLEKAIWHGGGKKAGFCVGAVAKGKKGERCAHASKRSPRQSQREGEKGAQGVPVRLSAEGGEGKKGHTPRIRPEERDCGKRGKGGKTAVQLLCPRSEGRTRLAIFNLFPEKGGGDASALSGGRGLKKIRTVLAPPVPGKRRGKEKGGTTNLYSVFLVKKEVLRLQHRSGEKKTPDREGGRGRGGPRSGCA